MVRAYTPWPEAQTTFEGAGLHILDSSPYEGDLPVTGEPPPPGQVVGVDKNTGILVQTGNGILAVQRLKLQSKKALSWKDFLNGVHGFVGSVLGR